MKKQIPQDPGVLGGCVSYAQNREDLILLSFFSDIKKGFYVDVGAFDPDTDSVTKLFYLNGWHGINIEPQAERIKLFDRERTRDINLNIGIAAKEGSLTLRTYKSQGLSTFSKSVKGEYESRPSSDTRDYSETTVVVRPLRDILTDQKVNHINFMKVDVEGFEYEVLASNDWQRYRPEVLCIEANHIKRDWRPLLKDAEYELAFSDGLNEYYTDKRTDRHKKFRYVKEVINDRGGGIRAEHYQLLLDWVEYGVNKSNHVKELNTKLEYIQSKYNAQLYQYEIQLNSIKSTATRLFYLLKRRLIKDKR